MMRLWLKAHHDGSKRRQGIFWIGYFHRLHQAMSFALSTIPRSRKRLPLDQRRVRFRRLPSTLRRCYRMLTMLKLDRITTLYALDQDRISLNATDNEGSTVRIWLTQRICRRLVPELVRLIKPQHQDQVYASVLASAAQQRALQKQEPQSPVQLTESVQEWLVSKIDMQMSEAGVVLVFTSADGQNAQLAMNTELLRQWLAILRRVYDSSEWKGICWPEWLDPPIAARSTSQVLH